MTLRGFSGSTASPANENLVPKNLEEKKNLSLVANFSPVTYKKTHTVGVPWPGKYKEIFSLTGRNTAAGLMKPKTKTIQKGKVRRQGKIPSRYRPPHDSSLLLPARTAPDQPTKQKWIIIRKTGSYEENRRKSIPC